MIHEYEGITAANFPVFKEHMTELLVNFLPLDSWTADPGLCAAILTACVDTHPEFVIQVGDIRALSSCRNWLLVCSGLLTRV